MEEKAFPLLSGIFLFEIQTTRSNLLTVFSHSGCNLARNVDNSYCHMHTRILVAFCLLLAAVFNNLFTGFAQSSAKTITRVHTSPGLQMVLLPPPDQLWSRNCWLHHYYGHLYGNKFDIWSCPRQMDGLWCPSLILWSLLWSPWTRFSWNRCGHYGS